MASILDITNNTDPALTCTLSDFVDMKINDETTYFNFSIIEVQDNIVFTDHNLIDDYIEELDSICINVQLSDEDLKKYMYSPDLLAYDVYGSTQLDFIVLAANGMVDPKEFCVKKIKLPYNSNLKTFLSDVASANSGYIDQNRIDNGLST